MGIGIRSTRNKVKQAAAGIFCRVARAKRNPPLAGLEPM
jgi:hypothetical protein